MSSSIEKDAYPTEDETLVGHTPSGDLNDKDASISSPN